MTHALLVVCLLAPLVSFAAPAKLTLWITVDGLSSDLMLRHRPQFKAGFAKLLKQGAYFPTARYAFAEPATAPGHATLSTGANPWRHGIVGNRLFNRTTGREDPVFGDPGHPVLEAPLSTDDASPVSLRAETLADRLVMATAERGRAIAIGGKGRSSIPFAGRMGEAYWFNPPTGTFVTGTFYRKEVPSWLQGFNERRLPEAAFSKPWTLSRPEAAYTGSDDRAAEADYLGLGRVFPHAVTGALPGPGPQSFKALSFSGLFDELLLEFAKAAIEGEKLGSDAAPDLLAVSFSGTDKVQHLYGPGSWEVQDTLLRLDSLIGKLLQVAEKAAGGRANLNVILSSDHGSAALPEAWAAAGMAAVRVSPKALAAELEKSLRPRFGKELHVLMDESDLFLSGKESDRAELRRAAAEWLRKQPSIAFAVARDDLFGSASGPGDLLARLQRGSHPDRSGDVLHVFRSFHVPTDERTGTNHGTPWTYDTDVPLILSGKGVRPGVYPQLVDPTDVAPTVASLLGIGIPASAEGRVLHEALR